MKGKRFVSLAVAAMIVVAACGGGNATNSPANNGTGNPATNNPTTNNQPAGDNTLTVWLMKGSLPDDVTAQLNADFVAAHPGWKVNYQVQNWDGIVDKLTTSLASTNPPDVVELGNTQAAKFSQAGALMDLTDQRMTLGGGTSADSKSYEELWLGSLNDSAVYEGKLYAMPFYAGDRVLIYRKDMLEAAGIDATKLNSKDALIAAAKTLQEKNKNVADFSGLYMAGQNWYALIQMIWDNGGEIAVNEGGTWKGKLSSPESMKGIQDYVDYYKAGSTGPKDNDEMNPPQYDVMGSGKAAMIIGNLWEVGSVIAKDASLKDKIGVVGIPSITAGKTVPVFLGGSDLGIAAKSKHQQQALDYLKLVNSFKYQQLSSNAGNIPATKNAAAAIDPAKNPNLAVGAAEAAASSRFVPNSANWASVEANNPMKAMLTKILSGQASIQDAAAAADKALEEILNTPL